MSIILGLILTFVVFLIVVLIHEFGHFFTARMTGMKVEEFGFGIPPRIKSIYRDKQGTEYTINALPIGGFVRILGEDSHSPDKDRKGAFITKNWYQRAIVLVAGVTMNFILAWVIFTGLFMYGMQPIMTSPFSDKPTGSLFIPSFTEAKELGFLVSNSGIILSPLQDSIAYKAGIRDGDILESIDEQFLTNSKDVIAIIQQSQGSQVSVTRDGVSLSFQLIPKDGKVGMYLEDTQINKSFVYQESFPRAVIVGARETYATSILTLDMLGTLLEKLFAPKTPTDREEAKELLSGPIGVGATFVHMVDAQVPVTLILLVIALLSVNLGIVNLLPFPALDGGRLLTTTVASLLSYFPRATRYFQIFEHGFHFVGFVLLLILMIYIAGLDISKFL
ncbi:site-2 protease family protein [Candidatus Gracilibacteria bacterium]|nr:site-2 protease family protein [Candidatus Gracilibacteria bacterium]